MKTRDARLCDVFCDVAVALFAGGGGCHDAFDKAASCGAVGAETAFAPKHTGPHAAFGRIVRRFDAGNAHKGPEVFGAFENPFARAFHLLVATARPFAQEPFDVCAQPPHVSPERAALQRSISNTMPPMEHLVAMFQQRGTNLTGLPGIFAKRGEMTPQTILQTESHLCILRSQGTP